ncbi:MAG: hypothetical protein ACREQ5_08895 [Candidatus Dormibacteria bacterium]
MPTLEKLADALEVKTYQFFFDGKHPPKRVQLETREDDWPVTRKDGAYFRKLSGYLNRINDYERQLLLTLAASMARRATKQT